MSKLEEIKKWIYAHQDEVEAVLSFTFGAAICYTGIKIGRLVERNKALYAMSEIYGSLSGRLLKILEDDK